MTTPCFPLEIFQIFGGDGRRKFANRSESVEPEARKVGSILWVPGVWSNDPLGHNHLCALDVCPMREGVMVQVVPVT